MRHAIALILALLSTGCVGPLWMCPDTITVSGSYEWGTVNGSDLAKIVSGGEADGVDSNYTGGNVGGALTSKLGVRPEQCPVFGGKPRAGS